MAPPIPITRALNGDTGYFKRTPVQDWAKVTDPDGDSVLHDSVYKNHLHCTKVIYERCPDLLQQVGANNLNPLHWAAYIKETKPSLMKFLISVADRKIFRMTDDENNTPLQVAILKSHIEAVELLIEADPAQLSWKNTLLRLLLEKQPNACKMRMGQLEWPALHYAAFEGDLGAIDDILRFCPESVHMVDKDGKDFFEIASVSGPSETAEKILQKKNLHLANKMSKREKELCIPLEYLLMYRELVKRFGEIVEPSKCLEEDTTPMYSALGHFLGNVYNMAHVKPENVTQEKISEWEKMVVEYSALGLQLSWFQELVTWFTKRAKHGSHFAAEIATKEEALKILENELKELKEQQRDTYTLQSDNPLLIIQRIEGIIYANSATEKPYMDVREKYRPIIYDFDFQKLKLFYGI